MTELSARQHIDKLMKAREQFEEGSYWYGRLTVDIIRALSHFGGISKIEKYYFNIRNKEYPHVRTTPGDPQAPDSENA